MPAAARLLLSACVLLGAAGDRVANAFIMEALKSQRPDDAILCEEEDRKSVV